MPLSRKNTSGLTNKNAKAAKKARGKKVAHSWNVRGVMTLPGRRYEVMVYDGDNPYSHAWLPLPASNGLATNLIPDYSTEAEALAAYNGAREPNNFHIMMAPEWVHGLTFLGLLRLLPGVDYGTKPTAAPEPGSEPGQSAPAPELGELSR